MFDLNEKQVRYFMVSDDQMSSKEMNMLQYENQIGHLLWNRVG